MTDLEKQNSMSLDKTDYSVEEIFNFLQQSKEIVKTNRSELVDIDIERKGIFSFEHYEKYFDLGGSIRIKDLDELGEGKCFFEKNTHRYFENKNGISLRGPRYVVAIDPNLSVNQKINTLGEDFEESATFVIENKMNLN